MSTLGVYADTNSPIHRIRPEIKLAVLIAFVLVTALTKAVAIPAALTAIAYRVATIPPLTAWSQLAPALPILAPLFLIGWWHSDAPTAAQTTGNIIITIMAAALLTLTTTVDEMLNALEPLLGEKLALLVAMTMRQIPIQQRTVRDILDARAARGAGWSITAFGVPLMVRSIRRARALEEALRARGV